MSLLLHLLCHLAYLSLSVLPCLCLGSAGFRSMRSRKCLRGLAARCLCCRSCIALASAEPEANSRKSVPYCKGTIERTFEIFLHVLVCEPPRFLSTMIPSR